MRYVLSFLPFVVVSATKLACFLQPTRWKPGLVVLALLLWSTVSSLAIHPHYLSYFNELAGGPNNGHNHLLDSNIDWGQDLLFLNEWLKKHPEARPLGLAYYNVIDPRIIGIEFTMPAFGPIGPPPEDRRLADKLGPHPGYYAVSVNYVQGSSLVAAPGGRGERVMIPPQGYAYFRHFEPVARAGYSILIYQISPEQANAVRRQLGLPPLTKRSSAKNDQRLHH